MSIEKVLVNCVDCGKELKISKKTFNEYTIGYKKNTNHQWRCSMCRSKFYHESHSQGQRNRWKKLSEEEKIAALKPLIEGKDNYYNNLDEKGWKDYGERVRKGQMNMTKEQRQSMLEHRGKSRKLAWSKLPEDERKSLMTNAHIKCKEWWNNLSEEERQDRLDMLHNDAKRYRDSLTPEEKVLKMRKTFSKSGHTDNSLHKRFERQFNESHLSNYFYYIAEYAVSRDGSRKIWDYGIFDENGELVCVTDIDGAYFHADICDYDGIHNKEEYDERRGLSVPDGIKSFIINQVSFIKDFEYMLKHIMLNYDDYIEQIFKECRAMPFPYPEYSDVYLMKSFTDLQKMDCNDKYHQDISLNTRSGDRLIQHFHHSILHDHTAGELSPYQAWYNDSLLYECIKNRIIFQSYLNPNKILQGFNISKKAPKVSVFSAGRAKMIINRYLSEFTEIFDPFSGYSGRMLGTVSLGKKYIGQDISERHVMESNNMIEFISNHDVDIGASVIRRDILDSTGEYECLFTCPPYADKEQWEDVPVDTRCCDDWIDECLHRFKCKRYVFVVDHTTRYKNNIVAELNNKSHFSNAKEYIIVI